MDFVLRLFNLTFVMPHLRGLPGHATGGIGCLQTLVLVSFGTVIQILIWTGTLLVAIGFIILQMIWFVIRSVWMIIFH